MDRDWSELEWKSWLDQAWLVEVRELLSAPTLELGDWEAHNYTCHFFNVKVSSGQNIVKRK